MRIECFHYLGQEDIAISDDEDEGAGGGAGRLAHALLAFHEQASNVLATRRLAQKILFAMSVSDLADLRKQCITSLYLCTDNVSKYLDSEKEEEFNKLKGYVQEYCLLEAQEDVAIQALERTKV
ncbi:Sec8 protein [Operophtera brumata]|uniref:Sec8 protein n=1 Tax=Operophtera brumata TaxID=104452 RepID=A0A0L7L7Y6_OPEBR|nr:Sec8 protein [Operophtera brumata]